MNAKYSLVAFCSGIVALLSASLPVLAQDCGGVPQEHYNNRPLVLGSQHGYLSDRKDSGHNARLVNNPFAWEEMHANTVCGDNLKWGSVVTIKSKNSGRWLSGAGEGARFVENVSQSEKWELLNPNNTSDRNNMHCGDWVAFRNLATGKYLVSEDHGDVNANRTGIGPWEKWHFRCAGEPNTIGSFDTLLTPMQCMQKYDRTPDGCSTPEEVSSYISRHYDGVFNDACNAHDVCYAIPGNSKQVCDAEFHDSMNAKCSGDIGCLTVATTYATGVAVGGASSYENAQKDQRGWSCLK